jgi:protoporphyrinogen oxidase
VKPVVIIGGGISGLSAAWYLQKAGIPATVVERRPRLGGVIQTEVVQGCVIEGGPDSFLSSKPAALELIRELDLSDQVIGSNDHLRVTYVWKKGRLIPLPDGLMMMVPTRILPMISTPLLGWPTKIRMGLEFFRRPGHSIRDRSVAEFVADHYGQETVDYLAEPLLSGVYGGSPDELSVVSVLTRFAELEAQYGSLTRGVLKSQRKRGPQPAGGSLFRTLKGGLGDLIQALVHRLDKRVEFIQGEAEAIERTGAASYRVRIGNDWMEASHVILACPAWAAGAILESLDGELAALLNGIGYSSSMTVALGYERKALNRDLNGFGFLVPRKERRQILACTWVGTKFANRVPEDRVLLRCFLGGSQGETVLSQSDEKIVATVQDELREIMGLSAEPVFTRISRWPRAMAQYAVGHQARVEKIEVLLRELPGLYLAGNAYSGVGIPDCIRTGRQAADRIAAAKAA